MRNPVLNNFLNHLQKDSALQEKADQIWELYSGGKLETLPDADGFELRIKHLLQAKQVEKAVENFKKEMEQYAKAQALANDGKRETLLFENVSISIPNRKQKKKVVLKKRKGRKGALRKRKLGPPKPEMIQRKYGKHLCRLPLEPPSAATFSALIACYRKANKIDEAQTYLGEMKKYHGNNSFEIGRITMQVRAFDNILFEFRVYDN